jgi:hypothetical protein
VCPSPTLLTGEEDVLWDVDGHRAVCRNLATDEFAGMRWDLADGVRRSVPAPAGWTFYYHIVRPADNLAVATYWRERKPSAVAAWLARRHPRLAGLAAEREHRTWLHDPDTAAQIAELPDGIVAQWRSADGNRLVTTDRTAGRDTTRIDEWALPLRPHRGLMLGLSAGWTAAVWLTWRRFGRQA